MKNYFLNIEKEKTLEVKNNPGIGSSNNTTSTTTNNNISINFNEKILKGFLNKSVVDILYDIYLSKIKTETKLNYKDLNFEIFKSKNFLNENSYCNKYTIELEIFKESRNDSQIKKLFRYLNNYISDNEKKEKNIGILAKEINFSILINNLKNSHNYFPVSQSKIIFHIILFLRFINNRKNIFTKRTKRF